MPWYAVHVHSNCERRVVRSLKERHGPETFLPTYWSRSRRAASRRLIERPLFPGYLFARLESLGAPRIAVLRTPGVVGVVEFGGKPVPIPEETIASLRIIAQGTDQARPHPLLKEGQTVHVVAGPFAGAIGRLSRARGRKPRLVVTIEILGRAAAVPIDLADVEPTAI